MRVYFKGGVGVGKTTIMKNVYEKLLKLGFKCELYTEPVEEWQKALILKYNNNEHEISLLANDFIALSLLKQRSKIIFKQDTIYLLERDFDCCKLFRSFVTTGGEELSDDFLNMCGSFLDYSDTRRFDIYVYIEDIDINLERIKKRNRLGENKITKETILDINKKHIQMNNFNLKIDNSTSSSDIDINVTNSIVCELIFEFNKLNSTN